MLVYNDMERRALREKFQDANGLAAVASKLRDVAALNNHTPNKYSTKQDSEPDQPASRSSKRLHADSLQSDVDIIEVATNNDAKTSSSSCSSSSSEEETRSNMEECDPTHNSSIRSSSQDDSVEHCSSSMHDTGNISPTAAGGSMNADTIAFRKLYIESFTDAFADELQTFREADSGKHIVPTELVVEAINATADNIPLSQQRAWLLDARGDSGPNMPLMDVGKFEADWL